MSVAGFDTKYHYRGCVAVAVIEVPKVKKRVWVKRTYATCANYNLFSPDMYPQPKPTLNDMRLNHPIYWCSRLES